MAVAMRARLPADQVSFAELMETTRRAGMNTLEIAVLPMRHADVNILKVAGLPLRRGRLANCANLIQRIILPPPRRAPHPCIDALGVKREVKLCILKMAQMSTPSAPAPLRLAERQAPVVPTLPWLTSSEATTRLAA